MNTISEVGVLRLLAAIDKRQNGYPLLMQLLRDTNTSIWRRNFQNSVYNTDRNSAYYENQGAQENYVDAL